MHLNRCSPQITSTREDTSGRGAQTDAVVRPTQAAARRPRHNQQAQQATVVVFGFFLYLFFICLYLCKLYCF